jgi:hypothetical protein
MDHVAVTEGVVGTATALGSDVDVVEANETDLELMDRVSSRARTAELVDDVNECEFVGGAGSAVLKETVVEVAVAQAEKMKADALMSHWLKRIHADVTPSPCGNGQD